MRWIIKLLSCLIPVKPWRKKFRSNCHNYINKKFCVKQQKKYKKIIKKLRKKVLSGEKIKVGFLHQYATSSQAYSIFDAMLESDIFDPYWIVNPDVLRSKENFDFQYHRTRITLIGKYKQERVLDGYDYKKNKFIDYSDMFDLATTTNPYDHMSHKFFQILYWAQKMPMFYISYFYMGRCFVTINNLKQETFNYFWKVFAENDYVKELAKKHQLIKGENIDVVGYAKMDALQVVKKKKEKRKKKKIILAPHHSIGENELECGAFLSFYDTILELPAHYPDIDFIYRPHPILKERLQNKWGKEKTEDWLNKMLSFPNVYLSEDAEYFDLFINSDALIHDCGSFMAEYLFVNHPCAYWMKSTANYDKIYTTFGHKCLDAHTLIYNKKDLFIFIDEVVIKGNDDKKTYRKRFSHDNLMINYPNVTKKIIEIIEKAIMEK